MLHLLGDGFSESLYGFSVHCSNSWHTFWSSTPDSGRNGPFRGGSLTYRRHGNHVALLARGMKQRLQQTSKSYWLDPIHLAVHVCSGLKIHELQYVMCTSLLLLEAISKNTQHIQYLPYRAYILTAYHHQNMPWMGLKTHGLITAVTRRDFIKDWGHLGPYFESP